VPDVAQRLHWDSEWAKAIGNPMAYDYGVMRETWFSHYVTDWASDVKNGIGIYRIEDGRIAELWYQEDEIGFRRQLGFS